MSDFDTDPEAGQDEGNRLAELQKKIDELEKDNAKYREERRAQAEAAFLDKYGPEIVEDVKGLPDEHRETMAEKLLSLRAEKQTEQNEPAPAEEAPQGDAPQSGLAAVAQAPSTGKPASEGLLTVAEIKELGKTDPIKANDLIRQGKFVEQASW